MYRVYNTQSDRVWYYADLRDFFDDEITNEDVDNELDDCYSNIDIPFLGSFRPSYVFEKLGGDYVAFRDDIVERTVEDVEYEIGHYGSCDWSYYEITEGEIWYSFGDIRIANIPDLLRVILPESFYKEEYVNSFKSSILTHDEVAKMYDDMVENSPSTLDYFKETYIRLFAAKVEDYFNHYCTSDNDPYEIEGVGNIYRTFELSDATPIDNEI